MDITTAAATIMMTLGMTAISSIAVTPMQVVRLTCRVRMLLLTHTSCTAARVGY